MAVVMLSEGCNCGCQDKTFSTLVNKMAIGGPAGCMMSEDQPLLSSFCPACKRMIDNIGDFFVNMTQGAADLTQQTYQAAGNIVTGVGSGVGGFIKDPANIPCAVGVVGTAFGAPMGLGGCTPQGYNEQKEYQQPTTSFLSNPLLLGGIGLAAVLLLTKKKK
jgi:hypothetical protein